ncbi:MAG: GNAT family N-acetyltransferase [Bryobacteraceae bacterium]
MEVIQNEAKSRFELHVDGGVAVLDYRLRPGEIVLTYAGVPGELQGHGLGGQIVQAGLDYARANGLKVIPTCSFVASYIQRHPESWDLLAK